MPVYAPPGKYAPSPDPGSFPFQPMIYKRDVIARPGITNYGGPAYSIYGASLDRTSGSPNYGQYPLYTISQRDYRSNTYLFQGRPVVSEFKISIDGGLPLTSGATATTGQVIRVTAAYQCVSGSGDGCDIATHWSIVASDGTVLYDPGWNPPSGSGAVKGGEGAEGSYSFTMPSQSVTATFEIRDYNGNPRDARSLTVTWAPPDKATQVQNNQGFTDATQGFNQVLGSLAPYLPYIVIGGFVLGGLAIALPHLTRRPPAEVS